MAFPANDASNPSFMPIGADLAAPDAADLAHQMGLTSGFSSLGSAQGWSILPRISAEEEFTDNVNEVASPRRWDLTTIIAPGVALLGNSDRVQLRLDYEPDLELHLREGSQNVLAQQFDAVGTFTIIPDMFYVDVRGVAGVQSTAGGIGGLGGLGQGGFGGITGASPTSLANGTAGLAKQNTSETASFSISPYLLYRFGDLATARLSVSLTRSSTEQISGFAPLPFVSAGTNDQTYSSAEESAEIATGDRFNRFRDTLTADSSQGIGNNAFTAVNVPLNETATNANNSNRESVTNRVDYQLTDELSIYGQVGWENINYSGANNLLIDDLTWAFGGTFTPNPDLSVTAGYTHQYGVNSATFSGRYSLTARTTLTGSYTNGIGTQLEQIANQLNLAAVGNNGNLVNAQTGGPLFTANNALGVESGIFRYNTLTLGVTSALERDIFTVTVARTDQTQVGAGAANTSNVATTGTFSWSRSINPDLTASVVASYSTGTVTAGTNSNSVVLALSLQYTLSPTVSTFARYNFYDVRSSFSGAAQSQSSNAGLSWYQDVFLVGITKVF